VSEAAGKDQSDEVRGQSGSSYTVVRCVPACGPITFLARSDDASWC